MTSRTSPRFRLDPTQPRALVDAATGALRQDDVPGIVISVDDVEYADPILLAALQEIAEAGHCCDKPIALEGVRPTLYKALYIAKIASHFSRALPPA